MKYYILTDTKEKTNLFCAIESIAQNNSKTCKCGFSWNNKEDSYARLNSKHCIVMANRPLSEDETRILQSAWVTVGKQYYKDHFDMPMEVEELDIKFNCVAEEIE